MVFLLRLFLAQFLAFLNVLCQIGLNSNRRCSFRETFFLSISFLLILASYRPTILQIVGLRMQRYYISASYANLIKHIFVLHTHFFVSYTSYNPTKWGIL